MSHDIRYNLLAVVPEQRESFKEKLAILSHNKKVLIELFKNLASKESFVSDLPSPSAMLKDYPPYHVDFPKIESLETASSTHSHSSSTVQGPESASNMCSDSEDSSVDTYRTKSLLRGVSKPVVYIYGGSVGEAKHHHSKKSTAILEASLKRTNEDLLPNTSYSDNKKQKLEYLIEKNDTSNNDLKNAHLEDGNMFLSENDIFSGKTNENEKNEENQNNHDLGKLKNSLENEIKVGLIEKVNETKGDH